MQNFAFRGSIASNFHILGAVYAISQENFILPGRFYVNHAALFDEKNCV